MFTKCLTEEKWDWEMFYHVFSVSHVVFWSHWVSRHCSHENICESLFPHFSFYVFPVDEEKLDERAKLSVAAKRSLFRVREAWVCLCLFQTLLASCFTVYILTQMKPHKWLIWHTCGVRCHTCQPDVTTYHHYTLVIMNI